MPKGFQRSEFLLEHGFIDQIVEREHLKNRLEHLLSLHEKNSEAEQRLRNYKEVSASSENPDLNMSEGFLLRKRMKRNLPGIECWLPERRKDLSAQNI